MIAISGTAPACPETLNFRKQVHAGGEEVDLRERYPDQVVLVVNTVGRCSCTPQYDGLEAMYRR